ncbi:ubiquitin-like small modifier protein 1 [Salinigranum salinum]|uniref:ubiquitin-like small modifier protein 1 n=1 Tax=Salinigranum salinum TaxID=1364937 RepID=UPI0012604B49|nr:ubiquitin-like small modifier protein 1 [Salinigranum salinum]
MEVNCVFFGPARDAVGQKSVSVTLDEGATVADAFDALLASYEGLEPHIGTDESGEWIGRRVNVTVDKTNVRQLDGPDTPLEDGAVLRVAPSVVGGAR